MKLSQCNNGKYVFLYNGEAVGLQYILRMIWNEQELPQIQLVTDDESFHNAVSNVVAQMSNDVMNGIDKEEYELHNLNTIDIEIDITKSDINKMSESIYIMMDKETE